MPYNTLCAKNINVINSTFHIIKKEDSLKAAGWGKITKNLKYKISVNLSEVECSIRITVNALK